MRRLFPLLLAAQLCGQAFAQNIPGIDEIIARNIKAGGGMNKLAGIRTIRAVYSTEEDGKPVRLVEMQKRPHKLRRNISIEKNTIIFAYDGSIAWQFSSSRGNPAPAPPDLALELKEQADLHGSRVN